MAERMPCQGRLRLALVDALFDAATATERELESTLAPVQRRELKETLTALWQRDVFADP